MCRRPVSPWRHVHHAVTTAAPPDTSTRAWRLEGYVKGESKKPAHSSVCHGDHALDVALRQLEADPAVVRITARPA